MMKRISIRLWTGGLLCALLMLSVACKDKGATATPPATQSADSLIHQLVGELNKQYPQQINADLTIQGFSLDNRTLVCTYLCSPTYLGKLDADLTRSNLKAKLQQDNQKLVKLLTTDSLALRYVYTDSSKSLSFDFNPQELQQMVKP